MFLSSLIILGAAFPIIYNNIIGAFACPLSLASARLYFGLLLVVPSGWFPSALTAASFFLLSVPVPEVGWCRYKVPLYGLNRWKFPSAASVPS